MRGSGTVETPLEAVRSAASFYSSVHRLSKSTWNLSIGNGSRRQWARFHCRKNRWVTLPMCRANVLLSGGDAPKLLDFGIARVLTYTLQKATTQIGTVDYMAPEAMHGAAGPNADLWGLGVVLFEMLTGQRPFTGEVGEVIQKIITARYDEKPLFEKGVDRAVVRVIRKMLQKDPDQRYRTAEELAVDLETVARRARLLDDDEGRLEVLIRASIPLICILSFEELRVLAAVRSISKRLSEERRRPRRLYVWSASRGLRDDQDQLARPDSVDDPTTALDHVIENPEDALYVFLDIAASNPQEPVCHHFVGDDLFAPARRPHGIPIGNLTSQFFGNVMLSPLNHFVQEICRRPGYVRYADDFLVFGEDKIELHDLLAKLHRFLAGYRLKLHPDKCQVFRVADGVPFLGWQVFPNHRRLRRKTGIRIQRGLRRLCGAYSAGEVDLPRVRASVMSWLGFLQHGDTWGLRRRLLAESPFIRPASPTPALRPPTR